MKTVLPDKESRAVYLLKKVSDTHIMPGDYCLKKKLGVLLHIFLFLCAFSLIITPLAHSRLERKKVNKTVLNTGWTVKLNNKDLYENVSLDEFRMNVAQNGTYIELEGKFPDYVADGSTLMVFSIHSVVDIYIDDELYFNIGNRDYNEGRFIGYGHTFVHLPDGVGGKKLRMTYLSTEDNSFSTLAPPEIYNEATAIRDYLNERFIDLYVALGLMATGTCISLVAFFAYFKMHELERLFGIGVFSLIVGCWSLCNNDLALIFSTGLRVKSFVEYVSLYLLMFPLLLYLQQDIERRDRKLEKILYDIFVGIQLILFILIIVCQSMNVIHFSAFVKTYQLFMVVSGLFIIYVLISELVTNKRHTILCWGFGGMLLVAIRDLAMFNIVKYLDSSKKIESNFQSYIGIAALIFVVSLLTDFLVEMRAQTYKAAENDVYIKMAYNDPLTGLYTRRKCHEILEGYAEDGKEYGIILFDLNGLKTANDSYGHLQGDELITRFSNILKKVYNQGETIVRLGGDEFTVIAPKKPGYRIKEMEATLREEIENDNLMHDDIKVSVSLGYALSSEVEEGSYKDVMKLADKRMYADKERYYKETGINRRRY